MKCNAVLLKVAYYFSNPQQWGFFIIQEGESCFLSSQDIMRELNNFTMYTRRALAQKKTKISL